MFRNYPKTRRKLPERMEEVYASHYKSNREGASTAAGISQKMENWLHKKVASDVNENHNKKTLEIGAGTLNQLMYEKSTHYDVVEPFQELYRDSPLLESIGTIYNDIKEIDLSVKYDRITSIATFEHILDLPVVIAKTCLHLKESGSLRTSIPNEGTFLWKLGWKLTTGLEFKFKYGLDYGILMEHEHVNTAKEIEDILNYFYEDNRCSTFGIAKGIALYRFYESRGPKKDLAIRYLENSSM